MSQGGAKERESEKNRGNIAAAPATSSMLAFKVASVRPDSGIKAKRLNLKGF